MKHLSVFTALAKNNFAQVVEFRANFLVGIAVATMWTVLQIWLVEVIFQFTDQVLDWSKAEVIVLIGLFRIVKAFFDYFFGINLFGFPEFVNRGDLDFVLTKPVNSLFLMSLRTHRPFEIVSPFVGLGILLYGFNSLAFVYSLAGVVSLVVLIMLGLICYYAIFATFAIFSLYFTRLTALTELHDGISQVARFPLDVITRRSWLLEILFLPLVLMFTYPTKIILGKLPASAILIEATLVLMLFMFVGWLWNRSLRHYSSASS